MKATFQKYDLEFKKPAGTSRGILQKKETYFLYVEDENEKVFTGECALFRGLSAEDIPAYEIILNKICQLITEEESIHFEDLRKVPSIQFGLEQVLLAREQFYTNQDKILTWNPLQPILFPSDFTACKKGIPINGLIWMDSVEGMREQIKEKIALGCQCLKLKIGVNWKEEHSILKDLRKEFLAKDLEIRVDANGGFTFEEAQIVVQQLAKLNIHSIEQPIKVNQPIKMANLCATTPIPIALDEELIGKFYSAEKEAILKQIKPQYIILKPSLVGGFQGTKEWINLAEKENIGWWITSALESNLGLSAIAQFTYTLNNKMPQGLGTGSLFTNNLPSTLKVKENQLFFS